MFDLLNKIKAIQDLESSEFLPLDSDSSMICMTCIVLDNENPIAMSKINLDESDDLTSLVKSFLEDPIYQIFHKRLQYCGIDTKVSAAVFLASSIIMNGKPAHSSLIAYSLWKYLANNPSVEMLTSNHLFEQIIPLGTPSSDAMMKLWDGQKTNIVAKKMGVTNLASVDFKFPSDNIIDVWALYHQTKEFAALFAK